MTSTSVGVSQVGVRLLPDNTYLGAITSSIQHARRRVLCSVFLVDLSPGRDRALVVDTLLVELSAARWRGTDVRLIVGGSRTNFDIAQIAIAARARALSLAVPCRALMASSVRGSHVKMAITDDTVHLGSHNWSPGAFTNQIQDSVAIKSEAFSAQLADLFEMQWTRAEA